MLCPFDATTLQVVNRSGVEIDWCPSCKGVWLERGELDKLIDLAASTSAAPQSFVPVPPQQYTDHRYGDPRAPERRRRDRDDDDDDWDDRRPHGDGYRSKKRKNLLSDIFDF